MRAKTDGLIASLILLAATAVPAHATGSVAVPDYLLTVERLPLPFAAADLMVNDVHGPGAQVLVDAGSSAGDVTCLDGDCTYDPDPDFIGEDLFTYRLLDNGQISAPAEVTVRVTPAVVPLAGDWNGDGQEDLGWYDSLCQTLFLSEIDWAEEVALPPVQWPAPLPPGALGWIPYAGDWNADGVDDVGFFDPRTRDYYLYVQDPPLPPGPLSAPSWSSYSTFAAHGPGLGGLPVAGSWSGQPGDWVGLYLPMTQQIRLLDTEGGSLSTFTFPTPPPDDWLPVAADWGGDGSEPARVGLYSPSAKVLRISDHVNPKAAFEVPFGSSPAGMLPMAGDWDSGEAIGFYLLSAAEEFGSFEVYPADFLTGGGQPLPVGPPPPDLVLGGGCPLRTSIYGQ